MKILVTTSDNYVHLIEPHHLLLNKYWPGNEIVYLGFSSENVPKLPDNCSFVSLGNQDDFGREWTTPLIPYIESIEDEYFVVTVEDMMLTGEVDLDKMKLLEDEIKSGNASKAILDSHLRDKCEPYKPGLIKMKQRAQWRTTLHPSIWRKDYFQKYLKPHWSAWQFEEDNFFESYHDGANVILLEGPDNIFKAMNVYRKGEAIPRWKLPRPYGCDTPVSDEDVNLVLKYIEEKDKPKRKKLQIRPLIEGMDYEEQNPN